MTRGGWRMLWVLSVLAFVSLLLVASVGAQGSSCKQAGGEECDSHATCFTSDRGSFCACNGLYTGNGIHCKYSTWRVVVYILVSVISFVLLLYLCLTCLGPRRSHQAALPSYPLEPYGYPRMTVTHSSVNNQQGMYPEFVTPNGYPVQTGYPVTGFPMQQAPSSKVPGPSGTT